jgi:hypothetical protein
MWDPYGIQFADSRIRTIMEERRRKALEKRAKLEEVILKKRATHVLASVTLNNACCAANGESMEAAIEASGC